MVIFPSGVTVDNDTKARTEKFFAEAKTLSDEELTSLVRQGICLDAKDDERYNTPMHRVAYYNKPQTVRQLIVAGANMEAQNQYGQTVLASAVENQDEKIETVCLLITAGANINALNNYGQSPLFKCRAILDLLGAGSNIEAECNDARTPLIHASRMKSQQAIRILLQRGANIYKQDKEGSTTLDYRGMGTNLETNNILSHSLAEYENFLATSEAPSSTAEIYQLLACMPLSNPQSPVDYTRNVRSIFAQAKWENKKQATNILEEMQKDGMINAETAESILVTTFPQERSRASMLQQCIGRGK